MEMAPTITVESETYWTTRLESLEHEVGTAWVRAEPTMIISVATLNEFIGHVKLLGLSGVDYEELRAQHGLLMEKSELLVERTYHIGDLLEQAADLTADIVESEAFDSIEELDKTNLKDIDEALPAFAAAHQWDYCPDCAFGDECSEINPPFDYCLLEAEDKSQISDNIELYYTTLHDIAVRTSGVDDVEVPVDTLRSSLRALKEGGYYTDWLAGQAPGVDLAQNLDCREAATLGHEAGLDLKQDLLQMVHELVKPLIDSPDLVERLAIDAAALHTWAKAIRTLSTT